MMYLVTAILLVALMAITIEDFSRRMIWSGWIPILIGIGSALALSEITVYQFLTNSCLNLGFVVLQLLLVTGYFSIRTGRWMNITKEHLGIGDVLFFVPLCLFFSPINFITFYVLSMATVLIGYLLVKSFFLRNMTSIPLAGGISILLICLFGCNFFLSGNPYSDDYLLEYFTKHLMYSTTIN